MSSFPEDIYTEPVDIDVDTLRNLGPLTGMAGIWSGMRGLDVKPKADGPRKQAYVDRIELQPIDPQTNGPQLLYGLRYHGICSTPFLEYAFRTIEYRIKVRINPDGTWSYDLDTVLMIRGNPEPFHHTDRNTLVRIGEPTPNPLARR